MNSRSRVWKFRVSLLLVLGLMLPAVLAADPTPRPLTLHEALELALKNHPRITQADLVALAAKETVREARSAYLPSISAQATAVGASGSNTRIAAGGLNNPLILDREAEGVSISQLLTDFGRTANLNASAKFQSRARSQDALATRAGILLAVNAVYYKGLQAQAILEVARQTVATRQLIFDQVNELATNKFKSSLDVSFARVDLESSQLLLANAGNDVQAAFTSLSTLLGEREQRSYRLTEEPLPPSALEDDSALTQAALRNRPDLVSLRHGREAAARFARAEKDLNYPTISAVGTAGVIPVGDPSLKDNYAAAGVNINVPIFEGMLFSARKKEAELKAAAAAEALRDAENSVIQDVRIAAINYRYAADRLELTAKLLASARESFELAQARYLAGSSSIVELSQAQLALTSAQIGNTTARYDVLIQMANLNYQTGAIVAGVKPGE